MKKISVRKTETVRLTSAAQPLYAGGCDANMPPVVVA
ncbi:Bacteriocin-like protein [Stackebrandtia soli]